MPAFGPSQLVDLTNDASQRFTQRIYGPLIRNAGDLETSQADRHRFAGDVWNGLQQIRRETANASDFGLGVGVGQNKRQHVSFWTYRGVVERLNTGPVPLQPLNCLTHPGHVTKASRNCL